MLLSEKDVSDFSKSNIEKLIILSDKKFIGINKLQKKFDGLMKEYLNLYYLKNSDNIAIRYLSNFISIEPSKNSANNSEVMKNFSIVQNKLNKKDIKLSLTYLNLIENSQTHFEKWIEEANQYIEFKNSIDSVRINK